MRKIKKAFITIGILVCIVTFHFRSMIVEMNTATEITADGVKEGDVIFRASPSLISYLFKFGTHSNMTHCGIIVIENGKPYVLETLKTLKLTPFEKFITLGKDGKYWVKRSDKENIKIDYKDYLGRPYDEDFKFDNGKFYCSELIYDIYLNQLGIELCKPKTVGDYFILGTRHIPIVKNILNKKGFTLEQEVVVPGDIFKSEKLKAVE